MAQNYGALIGELVNALQSSLSAYAPARLNVAPPQLKTASAVDQLLGTNFNRSRQSIFDELASVINTAYATSMNEQKDNERAYLQALANVSDNAVDTMRNQYAADAALGANAGMQAANALSAILGMQNSSITGVNDLFGNRSTLVNQKANDLANASTDATELYNTLQQYLADFSKSLYETDSTIYTTELASWNAYIDAIMSALPYLGEHDYGGGYYGGDYSYAPEDYYYGGSLYGSAVPTGNSPSFAELSASPLASAGRYALSEKGTQQLFESMFGNTKPTATDWLNPFINPITNAPYPVPPGSRTDVSTGGKTGVGTIPRPEADSSAIKPFATASDLIRRYTSQNNPLAALGLFTDDDDTTSTSRTTDGGGGGGHSFLGAKKATANKTISNAKKRDIATGPVAAAAAAAKAAAAKAASQKISQQQAARRAAAAAATAAAKAAIPANLVPTTTYKPTASTVKNVAAAQAAKAASANKPTTNATSTSSPAVSALQQAAAQKAAQAAQKLAAQQAAAAAAAAAAKAAQASKVSSAKTTTNTAASTKKATTTSSSKPSNTATGAVAAAAAAAKAAAKAAAAKKPTTPTYKPVGSNAQNAAAAARASAPKPTKPAKKTTNKNSIKKKAR